MRDILLLSLVIPLALLAIRRPWIGVMLWTWVSLMNPHRYTYGFAYDAPIAAIAAAATLVGLIFARDKASPFKGAAPAILGLFMVWMTLSWLGGVDPTGDHPQWDKVMKIDFMILVALALVHTKKHIVVLVWTCVVSLGLLGAKGGLFTIMSGGSYRVFGPSGSFIADNNHFALAMVMTIPLMRFLQMQLASRRGRHAMTLGMILLAACAMGSHSRGALLAISAMAALLWWRGRNKFVGGLLMVAVTLSIVSFMPDEWAARMQTIDNFQEDTSAMGRITAWSVAFNVALHYPFGAGFDIARPEIFAMYSPRPELGVLVAHSIYFQILGNHGFVGLLLYLALGIAIWQTAASLRKMSNGVKEAAWANDLAAMCQVSIFGFAVGGAFLNMAYFDLPYNVMVMLVAARVWVRERMWQKEPILGASFWQVPGLAGSGRA